MSRWWLSQKTRSFLKTQFLIFVLLSPPVDSCIRGGQLRRRVPKEEPPLVYKQHVPNVAEFSNDASGTFQGKISRRSPRFKDLVYNDNPDVAFKDEEMKRLRGRMIPYEDHYMSVRCKQKLDFLSMLVRNTKWTKRVRVRVTEAWDQQGNHGPNSLHYEGRALDITTSDRDRRKLGLLARLAVQSGFDYVYYATQGHVHVSCKADRTGSQRRTFRCFDGNSTVLTKSGKIRRMADLRIGDQIQTLSSDGELKFSPVLLFLDRLPQSGGEFLEVKTAENSVLTISPFHLIYRLKPDVYSDIFVQKPEFWSRFTEAIFAKDLVPGDRVIFAEENRRVFVQNVISRRSIAGFGAYAPLTAEGTIVVDHVVSSCYAATSRDNLAHAVMAPVRAFYWLGRYFRADTQNFGIHWYPKLLMEISRFLERWFYVDLLL